MADFSRIGRNNKNRGRAFERQVAEKLGWTRVPYSGAMKDWGGADVVDGFYQRRGYWAAECKTQQPGANGSISIKHKWVSQMMGGETNGRYGLIITRNVGQQKVGVSGYPTYVFMLEDTHDFIEEKSKIINTYVHARTFTRGKGHNFVVDGATLDQIGDQVVLMLAVEDKKADTITDWFVMELDRFKRIIDRSNLFVPEVKPENA